MIEEFYSIRDLLTLGWTMSLIKTVLGEPDKTTINPHFAGGSRMKWYLKSKVAAMPVQEILQSNIDKRSHKVARNNKAVQFLHQTTINAAHKIKVPKLTPEQLLQEVRRSLSYFAPELENTSLELKSWQEIDPLRDRLCLDYLTYITVSKYDVWLYEHFHSKPGGVAAKERFYQTLAQKIHQNYPYLKKNNNPTLIADLLP